MELEKRIKCIFVFYKTRKISQMVHFVKMHFGLQNLEFKKRTVSRTYTVGLANQQRVRIIWKPFLNSLKFKEFRRPAAINKDFRKALDYCDSFNYRSI